MTQEGGDAMHEILFRGKRVDNGEWVMGDGIHYPKSVNYKGSCWIDGMHEKANDWIRVHPETVGQYTGLKDRNGKKIFEGDIIKIPDDYDQFGQNAGEKYQVIFQFGGFRLKPKYSKNAKGYWLEDDKTVEVIGNIHDNPALLKG